MRWFYRTAAVLAVVATVGIDTAEATWPEDITPSEMVNHGRRRISAPVTDDWEQLILELGTMVANKPVAPADTLGAFGFDVSLASTFAFTSTTGTDADPSPWERGAPDEQPTAFGMVPTITIRKGFAGSLEFGTTAGWVGMTRQGVFSGFGRLGILEGWHPAPDITLQLGYSGYLGNVELDMGVLDFSARIGKVIPFGAFPGFNTAQFSPYLDYSLLRITAYPRVDQDIIDEAGLLTYGKDGERPLVSHRGALGMQITTGSVHFRLVGMLASGAGASVNVGMGFTY